MTEITKFTISIPDADIADLKDRLARTRWPHETTSDHTRGQPVGFIRELADQWLTEFDWRKHEAVLNAIPQFTTEIDRQPDPLSACEIAGTRRIPADPHARLAGKHHGVSRADRAADGGYASRSTATGIWPTRRFIGSPAPAALRPTSTTKTHKAAPGIVR